MVLSGRGRTAAAFAVVAGAALIRLPGLRAEPWMDEVWSVQFARGANSVADVLFGVHHDNSHPLNTLWLYLVKGCPDWAVWRGLSFASGLAAVGVMSRDEKDPARGLLTAALSALSAVLVLYSTEARGYAAMALCAVACHRLLSSSEPPRPRHAAVFAFFAALGFFAHPTFVFVLIALGIWAAVRLPRDQWTRELPILFGPAAAAGVFYEIFQRGRLIYGAGAFTPFAPVAFRALARWANAPDTGPASAFAAAALALLCLWELARLRRERSPEFWFHAALLTELVAFVAVLPFRYERYFFAYLPFALILAARSLTRLWRAGRSGTIAAAVLIALYAAGGAARVRALAVDGRGRYLEAVRYMGAETPGPDVLVGSDHAFRNKMMLGFYASYLPPGKRLIYVDDDRLAQDPPPWYLRHTFDTDPRTAPVGLMFRGRIGYRLAGVYPYAGMSGWTWLLYRRSDPI